MEGNPAKSPDALAGRRESSVRSSQESNGIVDSPHPSTNATNAPVVSARFAPHARFAGSLPDLLIRSSNNVLFYVHTVVLAGSSKNSFNGVLNTENTDPMASAHIVDEKSSTLDILLRILYDDDNRNNQLSTKDLIEAVDRFKIYGLSPAAHIFVTKPNAQDGSSATVLKRYSPLFELILSRAPTDSLAIYALAAHHNLHDLAIAASEYILDAQIADIDDQLAVRMGTKYLSRLRSLHQRRSEAFKMIAERPPPPHRPMPSCGREAHERVKSEWKQAVKIVAWEAKSLSGMLPSEFEANIATFIQKQECQECREKVRDWVKKIVSRLSAVKQTVD